MDLINRSAQPLPCVLHCGGVKLGRLLEGLNDELAPVCTHGIAPARMTSGSRSTSEGFRRGGERDDHSPASHTAPRLGPGAALQGPHENHARGPIKVRERGADCSDRASRRR